MSTLGCWALILAVILGLQVFSGGAQAEETGEPVKVALNMRDEDGCLAEAWQWLDTLPPSKREMAVTIMRQSHPRADSLRRAINEKKLQLANVKYGQGVAPETLARLGLELQRLRKDLRAELLRTHIRLARDAYIILPPLPNDAICLPLMPETNG